MLMTIPEGVAGTPAAEIVHEVDVRRLLAFTAVLDDLSPPLFDLDRPGGIVGHPVFHVCLEWPLAVAGIPGLPMPAELRRLGLHVTHAATLHRPIRPGDRLRTTAGVERAEPRSVGTYLETRYETTDADGRPVATNLLGMLYRGVTVEGGTPRRPEQPRPAAAAGPLAEVGSFPVGVADAIVYSECSGIWNPVHTDTHVARAAGLPAPILHGTACLGRSVSLVVAALLDGDPLRVARVACRFTAIIVPETVVTVVAARRGDEIAFEARLPDGSAAIRDGVLGLQG